MRRSRSTICGLSSLRTTNRTIKRTGLYKDDVKREKKGRHRTSLATDLVFVIGELAADRPLDPNFCDHAMVNKKPAFRDCHVKPNLVLFYRKPDDETLELLRLGSHSELGI